MLPILCLSHFLKGQSTMSSPAKLWQRILDAYCTFFAYSNAYGVGEIPQENCDLEDAIRRHLHLSKLIEKGMWTKCVSLRFSEHLLFQQHNLWEDKYFRVFILCYIFGGRK